MKDFCDDLQCIIKFCRPQKIYLCSTDNKTYVTFDIDCLDPAFAPGTGTPVAGGPSSSKMLSVLRGMKIINMVGADIVEVLPAYDHADITAIAGATVAQHYLGLLAERRADK